MQLESTYSELFCSETVFALDSACHSFAHLLFNKGILDASRKLSQTGEPTHLLYDECLQLFQSAHLATARLPPGFKYSDPYVGGLCLSPRFGEH